MGPKSESRVYGIAGCSYSGSTLLSLMLGSHSGIFSSGECHRNFQVYRRLKQDGDHENLCAMHHADCDFWSPEFRAECDQGDLGLLYRRIDEFDLGTELVVHSYLDPGVYAEMLGRSCIVHGLIILFKTPEAYYASSKVHDRRSVAESCDMYVERYARILDLCDQWRIPIFPMHYENMAENPGLLLAKFCNWVELSYESGMIAPWFTTDHVHMVGGNAGVFMHLWKDSVRNWVLSSDYWKRTYSHEHESWLAQNYRQIRADQKWRLLPKEEVAAVREHRLSREVYEQLCHMSESTPHNG